MKNSVKKLVTIITILTILGSTIGISFWLIFHRDIFTGEIVILKDKDFTKKYDFPGSGTIDDPYRIENLLISTQKDYGIDISQTSAYFLIQNCTINATITCIRIRNVAAGTAQIISNNLDISSQNREPMPDHAISVDYTINCEIKSNRIVNSLGGILVKNSPYAIISNNFIQANDAEDSIRVLYSDHSFVSINIITVSASHYSDVGILIAYSSFCNIINNNVNGCNFGLYINGCDFSLLSSNQIEKSGYGIILSGLNYTIIYNSITDNNIGIEMDGLYYSEILFNLIKNNTYYGIIGNPINNYVHYNIIWQNNFINNNWKGIMFNSNITHIQAFDSVVNSWNKSTIGNYWSDLVWNEDAFYLIVGGNNVDFHPLENPVSI